MSSFNHWWTAEEGEAHSSVFASLGTIEEHAGAHDEMRTHLGLYLDREIRDFRTIAKTRQGSLWDSGSTGINLNVAKSCVDTVMSKIVSHRPRAMFTTVEGRFGDRQKAKKLEQWTDGLFYREGLYSKHAPHVFLDAAVFGTGALKVFEDDNKVCMEWTWIGELVIDEASSIFSDPRVLFQRKYLARDVVKAMFPKYEAQIESVDSEKNTDLGIEDVIEVVEAWHLPSSKKAKDGKHVICVNSATLFEEKYDCDEFPFVFFRWGRSPLGFYGTGLVEELHGIQSEIKKLLNRIRDAMQLTATAWIVAPRGCNIPDSHFSNKMGNIIRHDGHVPPKVYTPSSMNSQVFDHLWQLYTKAFEIAGVSQLSASGTKPAGIESGIALRSLQDFETQRFAQLARDWEEFYLDAARLGVKVARKVYKGGGGTVKWADKNIAHEIQWSDVNLEEDSYVMRIFPVNLLPMTPAGKLATVEQMLGMGLIQPEEAKSLLDFPDLDKAQGIGNAPFEDLLRIMDGILYDEKYIPPQPEMNLEKGVQLAMHYWCLGHSEGAPETTLNMLTVWMEEAKVLLAPPPPPPMPEMGMEGMPPEGMPPEGMMPPPGAEQMMPPELSGVLPAQGASPAEAAAAVMAPPPPNVGL